MAPKQQKQEKQKKQRDGVSLRAVYAWVVVGLLIVTGLFFYTTYGLVSTFRAVMQATNDHIKMENAAHELMDASDYLTEKVQRFTVDGDMRFLNEYFTEAFETDRREDAVQKMRVDADADEAFSRLQKALEDSVALMDREYYAMRLVIEAKGYTDYPEQLKCVTLTAADAALSSHEKMVFALKMVQDDEYYTQKERIRANMKQSIDALEQLTHDREDAAFSELQKELSFVRLVVVLQVLVMLSLILLTLRLGIQPVLKAVKRVKDDRLIQIKGSNEFRYLARAYNRLLEELNRENGKLKVLSQTDALTGAQNRMALRDNYDSYRNCELTVMFLDLDGFKQINDIYGHEAGDQALIKTGKLLIDTFGAENCYRYGGDEFLVIMPDLSEEEFETKRNVILNNRPVLEIGGQEIAVEYSFGIVHAVLDETKNLRDLFLEADQKMYDAKRERARTKLRVAEQRKRAEQNPTAASAAEYTGEEMKAFLSSVSGEYDLIRIVDPIECRVLSVNNDGKISRKERCYGIWNSDQKCLNCTSSLACQTGRQQKKEEAFGGKVYHILSNPVRLKLPDGGACDAVVEMVSIENEATNKEQANDRAAESLSPQAEQYRAQHDSLTKVLYAGSFSELAGELILKHSASGWVMIVSNILDFRLVNTLFGVQRGNEVIARNAELLQQVAKQADGLCGRLGGDQFALFLPRSKYREEQLLDIAKKMAKEFSSGLYTLCVHFGVYEVEDPSVPVSVMCDRANIALRTIHGDMRETVACFNANMMQKSLLEQQVISGFETALKEEQFKMYLQPLVYEDGQIFGAEALVRWLRPDGRVTMPGEFVETLERAGLIHRLDRYIWECAVKQLSAWNGTEKQNLVISVNMSAKDLYNLDIYQILTELVDRYRVPASRLMLEITETALLEDPLQSNAVIAKLRKKGFLVEMDDFGEGYSSLGLLKDIHVDALKIDKSLLHEVETRQRSWIILESIVSMANALNMGVVTEGVETEAQLKSLIAVGCRLFQGYYFSRPIPVEEFEAKLDEAQQLPTKGFLHSAE